MLSVSLGILGFGKVGGKLYISLEKAAVGRFAMGALSRFGKMIGLLQDYRKGQSHLNLKGVHYSG